jgi:selenocysteine lyase/cysteine desulfurase
MTGGTPDVLGVVRAGLVFQLKGAIGAAEIRRREDAMVVRIRATLERNPRVHLLGDHSEPQLPIIGFLVEHRTSGRFLHWNLVTTLLSDLFGIQARGGCLCAGPYGHSLLNISPTAAKQLEELLLHKNEMVRPGFVRVSLNYSWSSERLKYAPLPPHRP